LSSWPALAFFFALSAAVAGGLEAGGATINPKALYPEGPLVDGELLYYAEMGGDRVMRWDGAENHVVWLRNGCGPTSVSQAGGGALNVLCHREEALVRISPSGETLKIIDRDESGLTFRTPNASVNDGKGGVYFSSSGSFSPNAASEGAVLYLDRNDRLRRVAEGIHYPNGVALSPNGKTLYVSEHLSRNILAFDVAEDGTLSDREIFVALDDLVGVEAEQSWECGPDGLAVDRQGNLFVAEYGAGRFLAIDPGGALLEAVAVPEPYITGVALSPDEERIFITAPISRMVPFNGTVTSMVNPLFHRE
jgi:sugar lactone lactonase YvrE